MRKLKTPHESGDGVTSTSLPPWGRHLEGHGLLRATLGLDEHNTAVGRCPAGGVRLVWRCDVCGNDYDGEQSRVAAYPFDVDGPVPQWVRLC